jgi:hypothetical protein
MIIRPQMRLEINESLMLGIVAGIPIERENQRFSTFLRLIWEPEHSKTIQKLKKQSMLLH